MLVVSSIPTVDLYPFLSIHEGVVDDVWYTTSSKGAFSLPSYDTTSLTSFVSYFPGIEFINEGDDNSGNWGDSSSHSMDGVRGEIVAIHVSSSLQCLLFTCVSRPFVSIGGPFSFGPLRYGVGKSIVSDGVMTIDPSVV